MDLGWFWYPLLLVISVEKSVVLFIVFAVLHHISCSCSLLLCFETSQRQRVHVNAVILPMTWHRDFSVLRVIWSVPSMTWGHGLKSWQTSNFAAGLLHRAAPLCCVVAAVIGMETVWKRYGVETIVIFVSHTDLGQWLRGWLATTYHYLVNSSFGYKTIKHHHISSNGTDFWAKSSLYRKIQKVPCVGAPRIPVSPPLPSAQLRVMAAMATPGLDELGESAGTHQDLGRPEVRPFCSGKVAETHMESYG